MRTSEAFPSKYLAADDLNGHDVTVTIESADMEEIGQKKEPKLVLGFRGKQKKMICNRTNCKTIEKVLGSDETDDWIGQKIILSARDVEFQGDMILALRVSLKKPSATAGPTKPPVRPVAPVEPEPEPVDAGGFGNPDDDEDIPPF